MLLTVLAVAAYLTLCLFAYLGWIQFKHGVIRKISSARQEGRTEGRHEGIEEERRAEARRNRDDPDKLLIAEMRQKLNEEKERSADLDVRRVALVRQLNQAQSSIKTLQARIEQLRAQLKRRRALAELATLGWLPLLASCMPEPGQQVLVGGLDDGGDLHEADGVWHARFLQHRDGVARLGDGDRKGIEVELDGGVVWISLHAWRVISDRRRSRQLIDELEGSLTRKLSDLEDETADSFRQIDDDVSATRKAANEADDRARRAQDAAEDAESSADRKIADLKRKVERLERELANTESALRIVRRQID